MDYNMMPPPPSSTTGPVSTAAGSSVGTGDYTSAHYGGGTDTGQPQAQQLYNNDQQQCTQADSSNQYTSTQYKVIFILSGKFFYAKPISKFYIYSNHRKVGFGKVRSGVRYLK